MQRCRGPLGLGVAVALFLCLAWPQGTARAQATCFAPAQFCLTAPAFADKFHNLGEIAAFGYPISRPFRLLGCQAQMFQRQVMLQCGDQPVQLLNLLDDEVFPYTRIGGLTLPAVDEALKASTPKVTDPDYASAILEFVRANAPDQLNDQPVRFGLTFFSTVTDSPAGTDDPNLLALLDLEIWGPPTSRPAADPNNPSFIYQRFQRGVMHYDAASGLTQGLILADALKQIMLGPQRSGALPDDLAQQARGSRFFSQYCPNGSTWTCRPDELPLTDLSCAFEPDGPCVAPTDTPTPTPTATFTQTSTASATPTSTLTPTETLTSTPTRTPTGEPTPDLPTPIPTDTATSEPTATRTPKAPPGPTGTPRPTRTPKGRG